MDTTEAPALQARSFSRSRLLIVGADGAVALGMAASILQRRGHDVAVDRADAADLASIDSFDLVVFEPDIRLPDALSFLATVRRASIVPLLVLVPMTARGQGIHALEQGADCFMVLPFDRRELVARSEALIRRYRHTY